MIDAVVVTLAVGGTTAALLFAAAFVSIKRDMADLRRFAIRQSLTQASRSTTNGRTGGTVPPTASDPPAA